MARAIGVWLAAIAVCLSTGQALAEDKVTVLSTTFVLERKFQLLEQAAEKAGVRFAWTYVDKGGEAAVARALEGAKLVIIDAPRTDDKAQIEQTAGKILSDSKLPAVHISVMNRAARLQQFNVDGDLAQKIFDYYVAGTHINHDRLFAFLKTWIAGGDLAKIEPPLELANGAIYHGSYDQVLFDNLPAYLTWWEAYKKTPYKGKAVIGVEVSSSYISDGQTRMLDETIAGIENAGGVPIVFYRSSRSARATSTSRDVANADAAGVRSGRPVSAEAKTTPTDATTPAVQPADGRPASPQQEAAPRGESNGQPAYSSGRGRRPQVNEASTTPSAPAAAPPVVQDSTQQSDRGEGRRSGRPATADASGPGFPNPKESRVVEVNEPLITLDGKVILNVLAVNTFIGGYPESRKAWHQAMGIPVIYLLNYRQGTRADYAKDTAGVNSFSLPFTLTQSEYIGMQDPVMLSANEGGQMVTMQEQMALFVGKAMKLANLQTKPNADKHVALLFWNHPPGEKNQGASNMNVPRSIEFLTANLRKEGYAFDAATEQQIIASVAEMLRPVYRRSGIDDLMKTPHWAFVPLSEYRAWYATLPESVRQDVEKYWGGPEKSPWLAKRDGVDGFVVPRFQLGNLVVMPQPSRGEMATEEQEKALFHDVKIPLSHSYMAAYFWIRDRFSADAIVHFGTHGTQEWTPGKERGMWAYDYPQILVGNTPVIYPYIVDNISEAIHVKRRGRGVIVSHQTPAFAPAGLSDDFVKINDMLREYNSLDEGQVKQSNRRLIIEQARRMNIHKDLKWTTEELDGNFDGIVRKLEDYLEDLGAGMQPLGLHTFGKSPENDHQISNVMQMLGQPLYDATGVKDAKAAFRGDYKALANSSPFRFVKERIYSDATQDSPAGDTLKPLVDKGRVFRTNLKAEWETAGVVSGLSARWIDPSYGGDPLRNPDALHTGRNVYGFDPSRVPTRSAYDAGRVEIDRLIEEHRKTHGKPPTKLTFSVWSTETMRHLGMLEGQIMAAMGVKPVWDEGGRVTGIEVIPAKELGRPRIDPIISITGLYRDQFPNVMERLNEALVMVAALDEPADMNPIRANSQRIETSLISQGVATDAARNFSLTRIYGNESGNYGTGLPDATLMSDKWDEKDGKLAAGYLSRMSWGFGPDTSMWSRKVTGTGGKEVNVYAEHLRGTDAAVFSRSSNLRGLLDTDHPFEYLGGISLAVRQLDGKSPQLYISNMRDPSRAKLETAEKFMAKELRAVYQHPRWMAEMQKEGYAGTLKMLDTVNNFWGWQAMDRNVVRDDQWQEFHETWVKDRYKLGMKEWFEKANPTALAQITERMLEAIRKDYWKTDEATKRDLVAIYQDLAQRHDVQTNNAVFKSYVAELATGYGLDAAAVTKVAMTPTAAQAPPEPAKTKEPESKPAEAVRGQQLAEVKPQPPLPDDFWLYAGFALSIVAAGMAWQSIQAWRSRKVLPLNLEPT